MDYSDKDPAPHLPSKDDKVIVYDPSLSLDELEKRWVLAAIEHFGGNKKRACEALGISYKTIYNLLSRYNLTVPKPC